MAYKTALFIVALIAMCTSMSSCTSGKRPFLSARVCLESPSGVEDFHMLMARVASSRHMKFFDRTTQTRDEYRSMTHSGSGKGGRNFVMNIGALREDGMGVTASELSDRGYQIVLGFSEGSDLEQARGFARGFISMLAKRWTVDTFPGSQGVSPSQNCD